MNFFIGQEVLFIHEKGKGVIDEINKEYLKITDEDGFSRIFHVRDVTVIHSKDHGDVPIEVIHDDTEIKKNQKSNDQVWTIDLHIEELVDKPKLLTNYEIVQKQLFELRKFFNQAKAKKIRKIVIIHGVGQGVLKTEVITFLRGNDGVEIYDGNYWEYGQGATVAQIRYKY